MDVLYFFWRCYSEVYKEQMIVGANLGTRRFMDDGYKVMGW